MMPILRRDFLIRSGLALGAALLAEPAGWLARAAALQTEALSTWDGVRGQFRLAPDLVHMSAFFLASHPAPVREAIERHRRGLDDDPIGYWFEHAERAEADVLRAAGGYLGVAPRDIALTDSTTMGLGLLYTGLILRPGQEILTTVHDHYSTEMSLRLRAERTGAAVRRISLYRSLATVSAEEIVDAVLAGVTPRTRIVAVTWVHSSTGLKLPIGRIAEALRAANASRAEEDRVLLCVDGVHGLGVETVSLPELGCDFFIAGTHKWMFGPRGTGLVWGTPEAWRSVIATIPTFDEEAYRIWMGELPARALPPSAVMTPGGFHSFEHRWAVSEAFRFHEAIGKARVGERIATLNARFKNGLRGRRGITVITPADPALSAGITCLDVVGWTPERAVERLRERGIVGSVTPYATRYLRLAPSLVTSDTDVDRAVEAVRELAHP